MWQRNRMRERKWMKGNGKMVNMHHNQCHEKAEQKQRKKNEENNLEEELLLFTHTHSKCLLCIIDRESEREKRRQFGIGTYATLKRAMRNCVRILKLHYDKREQMDFVSLSRLSIRTWVNANETVRTRVKHRYTFWCGTPEVWKTNSNKLLPIIWSKCVCL